MIEDDTLTVEDFQYLRRCLVKYSWRFQEVISERYGYFLVTLINAENIALFGCPDRRGERAVEINTLVNAVPVGSQSARQQVRIIRDRCFRNREHESMEPFRQRKVIESIALIICDGDSLFLGFGYREVCISQHLEEKHGQGGGWNKVIDGLGGYFEGILYVFLVSSAFSLFSLPFDLYSRFVIEEKYGFNRMTLGLFIMDMLKGALLSVLLGVPLLLGLFWFIDRTGSYWWLFAFLGFSVYQLVVSFLYPSLIAPLFNKYSPFDEGTLKEKILTLAKELGFRTSGIYLMDGSRRSRHGNAYFTGLGRTKRIVLFDTLVDSLEEDETLAVLAHEIGHEKNHHITKALVLSLLVSLAGFYALSLLLRFEPFFQAFGFTRSSYHAAVVLLGFCAGPFTFFLKPLATMWSRKREYQADRFAADATAGPGALEAALIRLSRENLANLTPHPLYSFFHYSHPSLSERIEALSRSRRQDSPS